jgi:Ser/Thr protein kinase RdoA (MazF antagonist)
MHVFDWDQTQRGWFMWDLSTVLYFPFMLWKSEKWLDGSDTPGQAAYEQFTNWVIEGYDSVVPESEPEHRVDRESLTRMVLLRREFYSRFCRRAIRELNEDPEYEKRVGYV